MRALFLIGVMAVTGHSTAFVDAEACVAVGGTWNQRACVFGDVEHLCGIADGAVVPAFRGGRPVGFKLVSTARHPVLRWYGVVDGDVLEQLNGVPLDRIEQVPRLINSLDHCRAPLVLLVRRGERALTLTR